MKLLVLLAVFSFSLSLTEGKMVCYFESWAADRNGSAKFDVEDVDPNLCSHLMFSFAGVDSEGQIKVLDPRHELCDNGGDCAYDRFTALKKKNPELVTILAIGGWAEGSVNYSKMAADPAMREKFITSTMTLLNDHDFDGVDMDWEFPTTRGGKPEDKENFITLLRELHDALHSEGKILTAAVSAGKKTIDAAYDVPEMAKHVDFVNLMTYDLHGSWEDFVHHHSGLYAHENDTGDNLFLNADFAVNYWIEKGMPSTKIVMGVPLYGRCWTLVDPTQTDYYSPAKDPKTGFGYNELCYMQKLEPERWVIATAEDMNEPYTYRDALWCCYENHTSVAIKANYAKDHDLAGMMVWAIGKDDFHANCHDRPFDLIKTLVENFSE